MLYIARQPIFDRCKDIVAYELLYRNSSDNAAKVVDGDFATASVLLSSLLASYEQLIGGKRAFINFTENLIKRDLPQNFSKEHITIEILENIVPDTDFINKLEELKEQGYTLALDDFTTDYPFTNLIELVHIIKVDFLLNTPEQQEEIIKKYSRPGLKFLAEKIETAKDFERASKLGYDYFQGYYLAKPSVFKYQNLSASAATYFELIKVLSVPSPNYTRLATMIETDVALTYKLFKCANSPLYGGGMNKVSTVREALVRLGFSNIKQVISMFLIRHVSSGQSDELVAIALQRAKLLELIAPSCGLKGRESEVFLVGLFSMLDTLTGKPLETVLKELPLADETKDAILYKENVLGKPLSLVIAYEKADWTEFEKICSELHLKPEFVSKAYVEAIEWASETLQYTA